MKFYVLISFCCLVPYLFISTFAYGQFPFSSNLLSSFLSPALLYLPQLSQLFCVSRIFTQCLQMNEYFSSSPRDLLLNLRLDINWPKTKAEAKNYCKNLKSFKKCALKADIKECSLPVDSVKALMKLYIEPYFFDHYWGVACADERAQIRLLNRVRCYQEDQVWSALVDLVQQAVSLGQELEIEESSDFRQVICCMAFTGERQLHQTLVSSCGQEVADDVETFFIKKVGGSLLAQLPQSSRPCSGVQSLRLTSLRDCASSLGGQSSKDSSLLSSSSKGKSFRRSSVVERESLEELIYDPAGSQLSANL